MLLFWNAVRKPIDGALSACRAHFLLAAGLSALINILYLAPTIYMLQVYDRVVPTGGIVTLLWITAVVGVALATLAALDGVRTRVMIRASLRLNRLLSREILDRLLARGREGPGGTANAQALREFDTLRQTLGSPVAMAFFDAPWTPLYLLVAFVIHPLLGCLVLAGGVILVGLALANERRTRARAGPAHQANMVAYAHQEATCRSAEVVRALGMRRALVARHMEERQEGLEANARNQFSAGRYNALVKFARMFMQSLALGTGAFLAIEGQISVGAIIAASVLLSRALQPVEQLVAQWPTIVQARQALKTIEALFASTDDEDAVRTLLPAPEGRLELDRVGVRDAGGTAFLLKNVSLKLIPGRALGVIGHSGAGKTTLARLAAGALKADFGDIRIDDANVDDWDCELLARHIGYLPQDSRLLPGTLSENISRFASMRGVSRSTVDNEVLRAASAAGIHEMILRLPAGYDTALEEGFSLSAGQAQRVGLARALYGAPSILILDEPNSALDAAGEAALFRVIGAERVRGAAIMIVAHRASILAATDTLLVLQEGAAVRYGPRQQVLDELAAATARENVVPLHERA